MDCPVCGRDIAPSEGKRGPRAWVHPECSALQSRLSSFEGALSRVTFHDEASRKRLRGRIQGLINRHLLRRVRVEPDAQGVTWARGDGRRTVHEAVDGGCLVCGGQLAPREGRGRRPVYDTSDCRDAIQALDEVERILGAMPWGSRDDAAQVRGQLLGVVNASLQKANLN